MAVNMYETGNGGSNQSNQSNLLFLDQLVDRTQQPNQQMNNEYTFPEQQTFTLNYPPQTQVTVSQGLAYFNHLPAIPELNGGNNGIITENSFIRPNLQTTVAYDPYYINPGLPFPNQTFQRFSVPNGYTEDPNMNFSQNIIVALQPQQPEPINQMGNIINLSSNTSSNMDYYGPFLTPTQWIQNGVPQIQTLDARQFYATRSTDRHDRLKQGHPLHNGESRYAKPVFSYSCLIALALRNSDTGSLPVNEIYRYMQENFPYFKGAPDGWKNSVRHNLSLNKAFQKTMRSDASSSQRKGCLWTLKPEKRRSIEKEIRKWFKKHPEAIRRSMNNTEKFEVYFNSNVSESADELSRPETREGSNPDRAMINLNGTSTGLDMQSPNFDNMQLFAGPPFNLKQTSPLPPHESLANSKEMPPGLSQEQKDEWNQHAMSQRSFPPDPFSKGNNGRKDFPDDSHFDFL